MNIDTKQAIIDTIGQHNATLLFQTFGGELLYIPKSDDQQSALRKSKIQADYNALRPRCSHNEVLRQLAFKYHLTTRQIWRIIK